MKSLSQKSNTENPIINSMSNNAIRHKNTSGPAEPISSKVSRSQYLTVLSAEPGQGIKKQEKYIKDMLIKDITESMTSDRIE
jgi:hypothetical protein